MLSSLSHSLPRHCLDKNARQFSSFIKDENSSMKYWEHDNQKSQKESNESSSYEEVYQSSYDAHASQIFGGQKVLSHVDGSGRANMVDVGDKPVSKRSATAVASIDIGPEAYKLVAENGIKKGNAWHPLLILEIRVQILAETENILFFCLCHI
jgi:hypothetical protein